MPELTKVYTIHISVERFLDNCSINELKEVDLLIQSKRYQNKMKETEIKTIEIDDNN